MKRMLFLIITALCLFTGRVYAESIHDTAARLESLSPEIRLDSASPDEILKQVYEYDPRLEMYFGGYNGTSYGSYSIINMKYINSNIPLAQVYVAENEDELRELVTRGLLYCNESINIVLKDRSYKSIDMNELYDRIEAECPYGIMGVESYNTSTSDNSLTGDSTYHIAVKYRYATDELMKEKRETEAKAFTVVGSNIAYDMPDYMKVKTIHDYIINNCKYAKDYDTNKDPDYYTAYGALVKGRAVCQGYTQAARILFDLCGIDNFTISGKSHDDAHTWNAVKLGEDYYHIDITWDDPLTYDGVDMLIYDYYNTDDTKMAEDHIWDRDKYKPCVGKTYNYTNTLRLMASEGMYTQPYKSFVSVFEKYRPLGDVQQIDKAPVQVYELGVRSWNYREFAALSAVLFILFMIFRKKEERL